MPTPAEVWQRRQRQVSAATAAAVVEAWSSVRLADPQRSFERALPEMLAAVVAGQLTASSGAAAYVAASVRADGLTPDPVATVAPRRFAGITSDGRSLPGLLTQPLLRTLYLRTRGADDAQALAGGQLSLETLVRTEVLDTGRDAVSVASALEPQIVGHIRVVNLPACDRCILLAGRFYSRSTGFLRHPRDDCGMQPVTSRSKDGAEQDPRGLFDGMSSAQQDRAFGKTNAEVIRRGGDIGQVVNARRGMAKAGDNWTREGTTVRGVYGRAAERRAQVATKQGRRNREVAPRPSPGALLRFAGDDPAAFAKALDRAGYF